MIDLEALLEKVELPATEPYSGGFRGFNRACKSKWVNQDLVAYTSVLEIPELVG